MATSGNAASALQKPAKDSREEPLSQNDEVFRLLVDSVRDCAIFLIDPAGRVASWNQGAELIYGYARGEILEQHLSFLYPKDVIDAPARHLETALSVGHFREQGWRGRKDGTRFWADVAITPLMDENGGLRGFAHITRDVTEGWVAEQELRNSEQKYRLLISASQDYAIFMLDPQGYVVTWNEGAERIKGYKAAEIIGQHFSKFYLQEAVLNGWPDRELQLAAQQGRFTDEGWRMRKDGSTFWASVVITALRDGKGELYGFSTFTRDITERWDREQRIQHLNRELQERVSQLAESQRIIEARTIELRKLSGQLLRLQDEERRRIARELHDALGQELVALKIMIERSAGGTSSKQAILELADGAIQTVRNLSYLLHPPLLDEAGLLPALHWYIEGVGKRSNIQIEFSVMPQAFPRLAAEGETVIFRIVQECLTNVYRHSCSGRARVELEKQPESVQIRVRDYGRGIPEEAATEELSPALGVGIAGMRERVKQLGGVLTVRACKPGTLIEASIPLIPTWASR